MTGLKDKRVGRRQLVLTSNQGVVQVGVDFTFSTLKTKLSDDRSVSKGPTQAE